MNAPAPDWLVLNRRVLSAELARIRACLAGGPAADPVDPAGSALGRVIEMLGLSTFERDILLLCAGPDLDGAFAASIAAAHGAPTRSHPTFGLALAALPDPHWSALLPSAPLRRWGLVELEDGGLTSAPLRAPETVVHALAGTACLDERLSAVAVPVEPQGRLPRSQTIVAERLADLWRGRPGVPIQLCGPADAGLPAVAAAAADRLGLTLHRLPGGALPQADRAHWLRLWQRDAMLGGAALLVDVAGSEGRDWAEAIQRLAVPAVLARDEPLQIAGGAVLRLDVRRPTPCEQTALWTQGLGADEPGAVDPLVDAYDLGPAAIGAAIASLAEGGPGSTASRLWAACRNQARAPLEGLARRIEPQATWSDLVLPEATIGTLRDMAAQMRNRGRVYRDWGMGTRMRAGLGVTALFAGPSGTGKSFAAEVLARELGLDLYAVDLSHVMSKWLGETEANLRRIFAAAEAGGAVLLFDEADALFGTRSEVKDSHDRYANIGVSYLLQSMETYRGAAVLTTNMKDALDRAFLRRLRFVLDFPHPDAADRARLWQRMFPAEAPLDGVDFARLAQLNLPGGNIRTIALNAAFRAAEAGTGIGMRHLHAAARAECTKLGRTLSTTEVQGWL